MVAIGAKPTQKNAPLRPDAPDAPDVAAMIESVVGCKWSLHVLAQIRQGVNRPGALVRSLPGLTTKVLNERLVKLTGMGVLDRVSYPEIPPRVEYRLTPLGERFVRVLDAIDELQADVASGRLARG